jgi:hypothetical protein
MIDHGATSRFYQPLRAPDVADAGTSVRHVFVPPQLDGTIPATEVA